MICCVWRSDWRKRGRSRARCIISANVLKNRRSPQELAQKYEQMGSRASGQAMSADYHGKAEEAEDYRSQALFFYQQANRLDPTLTEPLLAIGRLSGSEEHREFAIAAALKADPNSAPALIELGRQLIMTDREEEGLEALSKAVQRDPSADTYQARGDVLQSLGQYEQAVEDFNKAIELDPEEPELYSSRADCLADWYAENSNHELFDRAIADYDQAVMLDEDPCTHRVSRGNLFLKAGQLDEAFDDFSQAVADAPDSFYAYSQRGQAYLETGRDTAQAERDFSKAISILEGQDRTTDRVMRHAQSRSIAFAYRLRAEARRELGRPDLANEDERRANELIDELG